MATVAPTSSKGITEASELERQASKLRADAAALEAELLEQRLEEEAKMFDKFDVDGSGTVDVGKLRRGLNEVTKKPVDVDMALRVLRANDMDKDGVLRREDFRLSGLLDTLDRLVAEDQEKEAQAWREERRKAEAEELLPPANEDTGIFVRVLSAIVYILPLMDTAQDGAALAFLLPTLQVPYYFLILPLVTLGEVPFLSIILFFSLDFLSRDTRLPQLLRFSMRQAVALDIAAALVGLVQLVGIPLGYIYEQLPEIGPVRDAVASVDQLQAGILLKSVIFAACFACILYSVCCSSLGVMPDGIPFISGYAEKGMPAVRGQKLQPGDSEQRD